jgi:hypothetical protein
VEEFITSITPALVVGQLTQQQEAKQVGYVHTWKLPQVVGAVAVALIH